MGRPIAGRPRRRGCQGRAARHRRRYEELGSALRGRCPRRAHDRVGLFPIGEPGEEVGRDRHGRSARPGGDPRDGADIRRADRELQGRSAGEVRSRLRRAGADQPQACLLLDHRLRPNRPLPRPRRLRLHGAGARRSHEHHGGSRPRSGRRADQGRRRGRGHLHGPLRRDRHSRGPSSARANRDAAITSTWPFSTCRSRFLPTRR